MNIEIVGGGPAGLCFAILMKLRDEVHDITVYERNGPDDTFGWGVVFSDQTLNNLATADSELAQCIIEEFIHWDELEIHYRDAVTRIKGHGFVAIGRLRLLEILRKRAGQLGVDLRYNVEVDDISAMRDRADLVVAADGIHSKVRGSMADVFEPDIDPRKNRFIWLGTSKLFRAFTFIFIETPHGWVQAHAYRFDADTSTFIVECSSDTWRALGGENLSSEASIALCERLFASHLDGHRLRSNGRHQRGRDWMAFPRIRNRRWSNGNVVLLGDAAHTAHFSIGSGTKLAFEDAIELSRQLDDHGDCAAALAAYEESRRPSVERLQDAAELSTEWFESVADKGNLEPMEFCHSLLTRTKRVTHESLRARDPEWVAAYEAWSAEHAR